MSSRTLSALGALALLYLGRRVLGAEGAWASASAWLGVLAWAAALGMQLRCAKVAKTPARASAHRRALAAQLAATAALPLWALTQRGVQQTLGMSEEAAALAGGVCAVLWPLTLALGLLPFLTVELALSEMPRQVQPRRLRFAQETGLLLAMGLGLFGVLNFLGARHGFDLDLRYLKTTRPGDSSRALIQGLQAPVEALLFFPPASDVAQRAGPYFEALAEESPLFTTRTLDHAAWPELARELKVTDNGVVLLRAGDRRARVNIGLDLAKAAPALKRLDRDVHGALLELTREAATLYFTLGHGEASWSDPDARPERSLRELRAHLQRFNFRVEPLGISASQGREVPPDAAAVVIAGPTQPFHPEELRVLDTWRQRGGRLLVLLEPEGEPDPGLEALAGVELQRSHLHNSRFYLPRGRGEADRANLLTNDLAVHPAVSQTSRSFELKQRGLYFPGTGWLKAAPTLGAAPADLIRAMGGTWAEITGDHSLDPKRERAEGRLPIAMATLDPEPGGWRVATVADSGFLSDEGYAYRNNRGLTLELIRWVAGQEQLGAGVESEQDVRIQHARERDQLLFYGTTFALPALIVLGGALRVRRRRARS